MAYLIYGARGTGSFMVEAACAELGVDYEVRDLDARNDEHRGEAYASMNPQRKMPTLEIDGEVITESAAILLALDERHPKGGLLPPVGSVQRAQAIRLMIVGVAELYPIVEILDYPARFAGADQADDVRQRARQIWQSRLKTYAGSIAGAPYAFAGGFSLVDLYMAIFCRWDLDMPGRESLPKLEALMEAVRARPGAGRAWERHWGAKP